MVLRWAAVLVVVGVLAVTPSVGVSAGPAPVRFKQDVSVVKAVAAPVVLDRKCDQRINGYCVKYGYNHSHSCSNGKVVKTHTQTGFTCGCASGKHAHGGFLNCHSSSTNHCPNGGVLTRIAAGCGGEDCYACLCSDMSSPPCTTPTTVASCSSGKHKHSGNQLCHSKSACHTCNGCHNQCSSTTTQATTTQATTTQATTTVPLGQCAALWHHDHDGRGCHSKYTIHPTPTTQATTTRATTSTTLVATTSSTTAPLSVSCGSSSSPVTLVVGKAYSKTGLSPTNFMWSGWYWVVGSATDTSPNMSLGSIKGVDFRGRNPNAYPSDKPLGVQGKVSFSGTPTGGEATGQRLRTFWVPYTNYYAWLNDKGTVSHSRTLDCYFDFVTTTTTTTTTPTTTTTLVCVPSHNQHRHASSNTCHSDHCRTFNHKHGHNVCHNAHCFQGQRIENHTASGFNCVNTTTTPTTTQATTTSSTTTTTSTTTTLCPGGLCKTPTTSSTSSTVPAQPHCVPGP